MRPVECFLDPVCPWCWVTSCWLRIVREHAGLELRWRFLSLALLDAASTRSRPGHIDAIHDRGHEHLTLLAAVRRLDGEHAADRALQAIGTAIWESSPDGRGWDRPHAGHTLRRWAARPLDVRGLLASVGIDPTIVDAVDESDRRTVAEETATAVRRVGRGLGTPVVTIGPPDGPSFFGPVVATAPTDAVGAVRLWHALETVATQPGFAELRTNHRTLPDVPLMQAIERARGTRASSRPGERTPRGGAASPRTQPADRPRRDGQGQDDRPQHDTSRRRTTDPDRARDS